MENILGKVYYSGITCLWMLIGFVLILCKTIIDIPEGSVELKGVLFCCVALLYFIEFYQNRRKNVVNSKIKYIILLSLVLIPHINIQL